MIEHIVLFRFHKDATPTQVKEAGQALLALGDSIPEVLGIRFTRNLGPSAEEWPHVLVVTLEDMVAVKRYSEHPAHVEAVNRFVVPIREARLAIDITGDITGPLS